MSNYPEEQPEDQLHDLLHKLPSAPPAPAGYFDSLEARIRQRLASQTAQQAAQQAGVDPRVAHNATAHSSQTTDTAGRGPTRARIFHLPQFRYTAAAAIAALLVWFGLEGAWFPRTEPQLPPVESAVAQAPLLESAPGNTTARVLAQSVPEPVLRTWAETEALDEVSEEELLLALLESGVQAPPSARPETAAAPSAAAHAVPSAPQQVDEALPTVPATPQELEAVEAYLLNHAETELLMEALAG